MLSQERIFCVYVSLFCFLHLTAFISKIRISAFICDFFSFLSFSECLCRTRLLTDYSHSGVASSSCLGSHDFLEQSRNTLAVQKWDFLDFFFTMNLEGKQPTPGCARASSQISKAPSNSCLQLSCKICICLGHMFETRLLCYGSQLLLNCRGKKYIRGRESEIITYLHF